MKYLSWLFSALHIVGILKMLFYVVLFQAMFFLATTRLQKPAKKDEQPKGLKFF